MGGIASIVGYLVALLAVFAGLHIAVGAQGRQRTASRVYLAAALCAIATALVLAAPVTLAASARLEPIPNVTRLVGDAIAMCAAWCVLAMLAHAIGPPATASRRTAIAAGVLIAWVTAMTVLLIAARTRFTIQFATDYADNPSAVAYEAMYLSYMCWGMVSYIWLIRHYIRHSDNQLMRIGLQINMVAAGLGLTWAAWKVTNTVIISVTGRPFADQASISELLAATVIALIAIGVTLPSWTSWSTRVRAWRDYRALTPLWKTVTAEVPQVLLPGNALNDGIEFALYRRVIEIRDAQRALRPYIDPELANQFAGIVQRLSPERANLVTEAAELATALTAHAAGLRYHPDCPDIGIPRQHSTVDVHTEARWLAHLARVMRTDQHVTALANRILRQPSDPTHY